MAGAAWTEEGSPAEGVTFRFDGFDADAREAAEVADFARVMRYSHGGRSAGAVPRYVRVAGAVVVALLYVPVLVLLAYTKPQLFAGPLIFVEPLVIVALIAAIVLVQRLARRPSKRPPGERFTLRLSPTQLVCAGERSPARTFELADIDAVVGEDRLVLRLKDGTSVRLPACLPDRDHRALAEAVEERLAEVRAAHAGYRGEGERLRIAAPPEEEAAEQEAEAEEEHRARGRAR